MPCVTLRTTDHIKIRQVAFAPKNTRLVKLIILPGDSRCVYDEGGRVDKVGIVTETSTIFRNSAERRSHIANETPKQMRVNNLLAIIVLISRNITHVGS